jgi:hypothetical protein
LRMRASSAALPVNCDACEGRKSAALLASYIICVFHSI